MAQPPGPDATARKLVVEIRPPGAAGTARRRVEATSDVVVALLDDAPVLHDHDPVGPADSREAVGDHHDRAPGLRARDQVEQRGLGLRVECRSRLVEDEDRGIPADGAGDGESLTLSS